MRTLQSSLQSPDDDLGGRQHEHVRTDRPVLDDRTCAEALRDYQLAPGSPRAIMKGCGCAYGGKKGGEKFDCPLHGLDAFAKVLGPDD